MVKMISCNTFQTCYHWKNHLQLSISIITFLDQNLTIKTAWSSTLSNQSLLKSILLQRSFNNSRRPIIHTMYQYLRKALSWSSLNDRQIQLWFWTVSHGLLKMNSMLWKNVCQENYPQIINLSWWSLAYRSMDFQLKTSLQCFSLSSSHNWERLVLSEDMRLLLGENLRVPKPTLISMNHYLKHYPSHSQTTQSTLLHKIWQIP